MSPWLLLVPVIGVGGYIFYTYVLAPQAPAANLAPLPGPVAVTSGGARAQSYLKQLSDASMGYAAAKIIGGATLSSASTEVKATLDIVQAMAIEDAGASRITQIDLTQINAKIASMRSQIV
jgi:hypothetical protein